MAKSRALLVGRGFAITAFGVLGNDDAAITRHLRLAPTAARMRPQGGHHTAVADDHQLSAAMGLRKPVQYASGARLDVFDVLASSRPPQPEAAAVVGWIRGQQPIRLPGQNAHVPFAQVALDLDWKLEMIRDDRRRLPRAQVWTDDHQVGLKALGNPFGGRPRLLAPEFGQRGEVAGSEAAVAIAFALAVANQNKAGRLWIMIHGQLNERVFR